MLKKQVSPKIVAIVFGIIVVCFAIAVYVSAWIEPLDVPPISNVPAPLNVSNTGQTKQGNLVVNALGVNATGNALLVPNGNVGIGTASPTAKFHIDGTAGVDGIRYPDGTLQTTAAGIPTGAVMTFNLATCPTGWSELTNARGRYVVGLPSGGALGATVGTALSNQENRPTGGHYHYGALGVRGTGASVTRIYPQGGSGSSPTSISNHGSNNGPALPALINTVAGTNAPYIQLLVCQKN